MKPAPLPLLLPSAILACALGFAAKPALAQVTSATPATQVAPAKVMGDINGVPMQMQKNFMTRRSGVLMKWNPAGFWSSSPGAVIPGGDPDEFCEDLTAVSRSGGQIPQNFRFRHVGSGKIECRKDTAAVKAVPPLVAVNGVPPNLQRTFMTRRNGILMKWDAAGFWSSSPGAVLPGFKANELCEDLTSISRSGGQIPQNFLFRHVGNGKLECRPEVPSKTPASK